MRIEEEEEDPQTLSTREVYRLLKSSPSISKALRLAARLRRAAREGRALKDGRLIKVDSVDQAMDALLEKVERGRQVQDREAPEPQESRQREREAESPARQPRPERQVRQGPDGEARQGDGSWRAPAPGSRPDREENVPSQAGVSDVPADLRQGIINHKFNVVDRVWQAPESGNLPQVPRADDQSLPADSWLRLPHIAVNGMTNTGKSTLINHLLNWEYATKASSRPGRTDSIDFYLINNSFVLVDLPGYPDPDEVAYIGVAKNWESHWEDLVLSYMEMCASGAYDLRLLLQLQTSRNRPSRMCQRFAAECERLDLPMLLIMSKDDQMKSHEERNYWATQIRKALRVEGPHIHYTANTQVPSSRKGRKQVHRFIRSAVLAEGSEGAKKVLREAWKNKRTEGAGAQASGSKEAEADSRGETPQVVELTA